MEVLLVRLGVIVFGVECGGGEENRDGIWGLVLEMLMARVVVVVVG